MKRRKAKARHYGRPYGVGRIFLRGQRWYVQYKGKRYPTHSTEREAAEEMLGELLRGEERGENTGYTVERLLNDFIAKRKSKWAKGTYDTYKSQADTQLKPYFGKVQVQKLDTDMLSDYREMREGQISATSKRKILSVSVNRELALLRSAMNDLAHRRPKLLPKMPHFPMEKEDNTRQGFITEHDFKTKLFPELPRHLQVLAVCGFYCGGRVSEWLRINWSDVNFERGYIHFEKTKNGVQRDVPIIRGLMRKTLLETKALELHDEAVFVYQGKRLCSVGNAWEHACKRAGFEDLHFHDLRRSANRLMRDRGVPQGVRMKIMGHLTASMDLRYGVVDAADIEDAARKMAGKEGEE